MSPAESVCRCPEQPWTDREPPVGATARRKSKKTERRLWCCRSHGSGAHNAGPQRTGDRPTTPGQRRATKHGPGRRAHSSKRDRVGALERPVTVGPGPEGIHNARRGARQRPGPDVSVAGPRERTSFVSESTPGGVDGSAEGPACRSFCLTSGALTPNPALPHQPPRPPLGGPRPRRLPEQSVLRVPPLLKHNRRPAWTVEWCTPGGLPRSRTPHPTGDRSGPPPAPIGLFGCEARPNAMPLRPRTTPPALTRLTLVGPDVPLEGVDRTPLGPTSRPNPEEPASDRAELDVAADRWLDTLLQGLRVELEPTVR